MANTNNPATQWNAPNYVGELFLIGANDTPFLNMVGGLQGGGVTLASMQFAVAQPWALEAAAQPAIDETTSLTAPTAWTYVREQDTNVCQIFQKAISVSYVKQSVSGMITADGTTGLQLPGGNPVQNEFDFQVAAALQQIAIDAEYTFLHGAYQLGINAGVAYKTRGIVTATTTNTVAAGSVTLSKALIDQLLRTMAGNGAKFQNSVVFCNAFQKQQFSNIYGYAPTDRNVGGVNIKQIETDFAMLGIVWTPKIAAGTLLIADLSVCRPVFCPVPNKGVLFRDTLAKVGASEKEQIYGQIGLDYGPEEYHGTITGLATS